MAKPRVLVLAPYPETQAASRFRAWNYFPWLEQRGLQVDFHPFVDPEFMSRFYKPGRRFSKAQGLIASAIRRLALTLRSGRYDAVFVQREAATLGPAVCEAIFTFGHRIPLIFDFDDAIWLDRSSASLHPLAAKLLRYPQKTRSTIRFASHVIAGSQHLANFARPLNDNVTVLPTVVSREVWKPLPGRLDGQWAPGRSVPHIGWIGSHSTAHQLDLAIPALRRLAREGYNFQVRLVGASRDFQVEGIPVQNEAWRLDREVSDFQSIDIGLAPMMQGPWYEGKCGFKQLEFMAVGVPQVSSFVGGARDFVVDGENALVAHTEEDWYRHIRALLDSAELRARIARKGRELIENKLCLEKQGPVFADIVEQLAKKSQATGRRPRSVSLGNLGATAS